MAEAMARPAKAVRSALRVNDLLFINEYFKNGRNGTRAYQFAHPKASYNVARARASQVLAKDCVQAEIAKRVQHDAGVTKAYIESSLLRYQHMADEKGDYIAGASICMDAAKLAGLLVEKREVKQVSEEEKSSLRALVQQALRPLAASESPTSRDDDSVHRS